MKCPRCGGPTSVYESRPLNDSRIRARVCNKCHKIFYTLETVVDDDLGHTYLNKAQQEMARRLKG